MNGSSNRYFGSLYQRVLLPAVAVLLAYYFLFGSYVHNRLQTAKLKANKSGQLTEQLEILDSVRSERARLQQVVAALAKEQLVSINGATRRDHGSTTAQKVIALLEICERNLVRCQSQQPIEVPPAYVELLGNKDAAPLTTVQLKLAGTFESMQTVMVEISADESAIVAWHVNLTVVSPVNPLRLWTVDFIL